MVLAVCSISLLASMALSPKLWVLRSNFPNVPLSEGWTSLSILTLPLLAILLAGLILLNSRLQNGLRPAGGLLYIMSICALCMLDLMRCQPWVYLHSLLIFFGSFSLLNLSQTTDSRSLIALNACRLAMAGTYIHSGLSKFTPGFGAEALPFMLSPLQKLLPAGLPLPLLDSLAAVLPAVEVLAGLLLLIPQARLAGLLIAAMMHFGILLSLGPLGSNWNSVVWPWNVAMIWLLWLLFTGGATYTARSLLWPGWHPKHSSQYLAILLCLLLPGLNLANMWPAYMSSALYSGNVHKGIISFKYPEGQPNPNSILNRPLSATAGIHFDLDIYSWSFKELNVPPFPEYFVFQQIAHLIRDETPADVECRLTIYPKRILADQRSPIPIRYDRQYLEGTPLEER